MVDGIYRLLTTHLSTKQNHPKTSLSKIPCYAFIIQRRGVKGGKTGLRVGGEGMGSGMVEEGGGVKGGGTQCTSTYYNNRR